MRILVTRTDRLGDVILATPVLRKLRELNPNDEIFFLAQRHWHPILQYGAPIELLPHDPNVGEKSLSDLIRKQGIDVAYVLKDEEMVSRAIKSAGVPVRVGPYSTLRSFFIFNEGKWQRRSKCLMHEAEYNLDLIAPRQPAVDASDLPRAWVATSDSAKIRAQQYLSKKKLGSRGFIVIHPGSSGSARYVEIAKIHYLAQRLMQRGHRVVVSGGPGETAILEAFREKAQGVLLLGPADGLELDGMAEVYRHAKVVIAHGTGPLHLAAAVDTPTFAIFPPLFVLSEKRWGPLISRRSVWVPGVECPETYKCRGERCAHFDCMNLFDVESAVQEVERVSV
ncbi:MAG: glycosyltransferase family 9 protein [Bdellovibrionales bacterium]|nr:glycosyltransferase family 9 protein [Bdellovibrionales bacterium]